MIPTYNRAELLPRAIDSVLGQSVPARDIWVIDDCSTDNTEQLLKQKFPSIGYKRMTSKSNASVARNLGIDQSAGDYIAFLDSDDEWEYDHLANAITGIESEPACCGCAASFVVHSGQKTIVRAFQRQLSSDPLNDVLSGRIDIRTSSLVIRTEDARRAMFDEQLEKHQDWDFAARLGAHKPLLVLPAASVKINSALGDRMSAAPNHAASAYFLAKHASELDQRSKARFQLDLAYRTFRISGRNKRFWRYWIDAALGVHHLSPRGLAKLSVCVTPLGRFALKKVG
ncbi:glycosyltransferase family 2 protein [Salinisphaera dokdonensis]|uniref:glycosyltransferase family 2 protein n=1 Tax=Salinisphaera dokdonensis TaxID=454598 RepID=UPI003DA72B05